jgi:hypothetical protein
MTDLALKKFTRFDDPRVIAKIRRSILAALAGGECVVVIEDGAVGLTDAARAEIQRDWPSTKFRFSRPHPSATSTAKKRRNERRPRL